MVVPVLAVVIVGVFVYRRFSRRRARRQVCSSLPDETEVLM